MSSHYLSPILWWPTPPAMRGCPSWMDSSGTTRARCTRTTRGTPPSGHLSGYSATQLCPLDLRTPAPLIQRAMDKIFSKLTRKTVECYVVDIAIKSRHKGDHLRDLKEVFDLMRSH